MRTIKVKGMTCNHCVMAVTKALNQIQGVADVKVNLDKGEAQFEETEPVDMELIKAGIAKAGFEVV